MFICLSIKFSCIASKAHGVFQLVNGKSLSYLVPTLPIEECRTRHVNTTHVDVATLNHIIFSNY
jgi:hypothetical protein